MSAVAVSSALERGYLRCGLCTLVNDRGTASGALRCARCNSRLHERKPDSLARTWALLIAAYVLYVPANLLPVLAASSPRGVKWDTILGGVLQLMHDGAWPLAIVILVASIGVPLAKLIALTWLLVTVHARSTLHCRGRTVVVRVLESIGRWSMVDIYVGGLLVALVQFEPLASIIPGPAAIAFGAVVVLTVLASRSFDSRLVWDAARESPHALPEPARA
jgi:paraquat-inducible protein A